jgi:hypothetical protein
MAAYAHYVAHIIIKGKDLIKGLVVFDNYLHTQIKRWGGGYFAALRVRGDVMENLANAVESRPITEYAILILAPLGMSNKTMKQQQQ